eukprot:XP_013988906.1 PREDICTED: putative uncharacterized protein DDB_G0288537 [Salmo salar]
MRLYCSDIASAPTATAWTVTRAVNAPNLVSPSSVQNTAKAGDQIGHAVFFSEEGLLTPNLLGVFTSAQRAALSRVSLARIICDNTGITVVSNDPFIQGKNKLINCNSIPQLNLQAWREGQQNQNQEEDQEQQQQQQQQQHQC